MLFVASTVVVVYYRMLFGDFTTRVFNCVLSLALAHVVRDTVGGSVVDPSYLVHNAQRDVVFARVRRCF
jgi:hypothetical protein